MTTRNVPSDENKSSKDKFLAGCEGKKNLMFEVLKEESWR
jgi:hypothetical protein